MRRVVSTLAMLAATTLTTCTAPGEEPAPPPRQKPLHPRHPPLRRRRAPSSPSPVLFDALAERDGETLRALMHPDVVMRSVEVAGDGERSIATSTVDDLVARVEGSAEVLTERMFDPEVRISGDWRWCGRLTTSTWATR